MVKCVHLTTVHPPADTRIFFRECASLARVGYQVVLIAPGSAPPAAERLGIRIVSLPKARSRTGRLVRTMRAAYEAASRERPAIFHVHDPELLPVAVRLRVLGEAVIYDAHEDFADTFEYKDYLPGLLRAFGPIARRLEHGMVARLSGVVAATPQIGRRLAESNAIVSVVQNFPDLAHFPQPSPRAWADRQYDVVHVGSNSEARGLMAMIDAMELVPESTTRLRLVGSIDSQLIPELERRAGWSRVDWVGPLPWSAVPATLLDARIGVIVLQPKRNYVDSYPTKLFEYMAAGMAIVASDFPLWRSILRGVDCALLVNPERPEEIANAITSLLANPARAEAMGKAGRCLVEEHYNWDGEASKLASLYQRIAEGSGS